PVKRGDQLATDIGLLGATIDRVERNAAQHREQHEHAQQVDQLVDLIADHRFSLGLTAATVIEMVTSSPSIRPPPSAARFQVTPNSVRSMVVLASNPCRSPWPEPTLPM